MNTITFPVSAPIKTRISAPAIRKPASTLRAPKFETVVEVGMTCVVLSGVLLFAAGLIRFALLSF
jgi:hypothetical protein